MKSHSITRFVCIGVLALAGLAATPATSLARDYHGYSSHHGHHSYYSSPRSRFTLSFGSGYRGRGYYYGPSGSSYYYEAPGVTYYRTQPSYYTGRTTYDRGGVNYSVQRALARRGYYRGDIDGDLGPRTCRAIERYQDDRGLRITGSINTSLLRSLGL